MGDDRQPLSPEDLETVNAIAAYIGEHLMLTYPELDEEKLVEIATLTAYEQHSINNEILPTLVGPKALSHPTLIASLRVGNGPPTDVGADVVGRKQFEPGMDVGQAVTTAMLHGLLHSPHVRAQLRVCGFAYTFKQSAAPVPGKIVTH